MFARCMGIRMRRRQCAAHSGGRIAELIRRSDATKFGGIWMHRRQCAAHSGVHTAGQRRSGARGCDKGNAQPTAAYALRIHDIRYWDGNTQPTAARALQRDDILRHSNATKAMRSPQRHTHCGATTLLDLCLPVLVVSLYALNWLSTLNVTGWQYVKCHNMLLHKKMKSQLLILVRTAASHTTLLYSSAL